MRGLPLSLSVCLSVRLSSHLNYKKDDPGASGCDDEIRRDSGKGEEERFEKRGKRRRGRKDVVFGFVREVFPEGGGIEGCW